MSKKLNQLLSVTYTYMWLKEKLSNLPIVKSCVRNSINRAAPFVLADEEIRHMVETWSMLIKSHASRLSGSAPSSPCICRFKS